MTEQKQTPQLTREQLERKRKNWDRFHFGSYLGGICLAIGVAVPASYYFYHKPSEEFNRYINAEQTYNYLQGQKDEVEAPDLPYENEAIQKFLELDADKIKAKALEDAIKSASEEMNANFEVYNQHNSDLGAATGKLLAVSFLPAILGYIGLIYGGNKTRHYSKLIRQSPTEAKR